MKSWIYALIKGLSYSMTQKYLPLQHFTASAELTDFFCRAHNRTGGLKIISLRRAGIHLSGVVEDGLNRAFFQLAWSGKSTSVADPDSGLFATAFDKGLAPVMEGPRAITALRLRDELRDTLKTGAILLTENGHVSYKANLWRLELLK